MSELLKAGQTVDVGRTGIQCTVEAFLGGGGQGEVYRAKMKGANRCALKWYFPQRATDAHDVVQVVGVRLPVVGRPLDRRADH